MSSLTSSARVTVLRDARFAARGARGTRLADRVRALQRRARVLREARDNLRRRTPVAPPVISVRRARTRSR